ncbi:MAG: excinuclease ABC subunit UvrC [Pseudomonadota bacterium]
MNRPDHPSDDVDLPAIGGTDDTHADERAVDAMREPADRASDDLPAEADGPQPTGPSVIASYVKTAPAGPGVYRMLDTAGEVLYVGKARSVKKRIQSYARIGGQSNRIARMILATAAMEFVTTRTESEALLLEANMIKRLRPRYNVLLRDDKSFPYILIGSDHEAPQLLKHRGARKRKGDYYGPFASAGAVNRTINTLQRAFLLRSCSDSVYESRTRPCLLFQIKRCAGPCTGEISPEDYAGLVDQARAFLRGRSNTVRDKLHAMMQSASDAMEYEQAARYRNRLWALSHVTSHQGINPQGIEEADVFAAHQDAGQVCVQVFFFRSGQNWGNRAYYPKADKTIDIADVLEAFVAQFYDDKPPPRAILLSHEVAGGALLAEALSTKAERKVSVSAPQRGTKRELVDHALSNAKEALGRKLAETNSQRRLLEGVRDAFGLDKVPRRIEVYDNSHIQGTNAVGAMIVSGPEGFAKAHYRKFNMDNEELTPGDDFGMMREMLTRRFKRLVKEHGDEPAQATTKADSATAADSDEADAVPAIGDATVPAWPDLVLIDGGKGQLSSATAVLEELGVADRVPVAGIAKGPDRDAGREHFYTPDGQTFMLEPRDPVLYFVQRLRDEAHRFAIGSHRARRKKAIAQNPLDEIEGIGPTRKRALLQHFGSAKAVSRAGVADLTEVEGISSSMAQTVYDFFHEAGG